MHKLKAIEKRLCKEFGEGVAKRKLKYIIDALDNLTFSSNPGESMEYRYGVKTHYRYIIILSNIFIIDIKNDELFIIQVFDEKEDFIDKMYNISMRSRESIKYWGE